MESKLMLQNIEKPSQRLIIKVLLFSTFVISICGLTYELLIGSLSTNLEGNPILQYSLTIGFFMSALGLGSYLSRFFIHRLLYQFIIIEIVLGVIGGISIAVLNLVYINLNSIYPIANILVLVIIGILVGLEIPIITRILKDFGNLKETISNVLTIDYIGGLAASLIFPLVLYPFLGLIKTAFIVGFINVIIGIINLIIFSDEIKKEKIAIWLASILSLMVLGSGIIFSNLLTGYYSYQLYAALNPTQLYGTVLYNEQSRYQKIVLTRYLGETQLLLNGHLQFSSFDEYRYHEALIFPPFMLKDDLKTILIMGGGDGLGVKQILKFSPYHNLNVILVDLDPQMTQLAKTFPIMKEINDNAFNNPSVTIINQDAYKYLGSTNLKFDVIYADFPDPHDATLSKLYSMEFFHFVKRRLNKNGMFITQATSPLHSRLTFWCIGKTLKTVFKTVIPYHVNVPTMGGDWGFFLASDENLNIKDILEKKSDKTSMRLKEINSKFFSKNIFFSSLIFPNDSKLMKNEEVKVNHFSEPIIYQYLLKGWKYNS